jgi:3',5'-cyclic AMP phosphodiesterase CpdA
VLLSDTHIHSDLDHVYRGVAMGQRLAAAAGQVLALRPRPGQVIINGDLSLDRGNPGDYVTLNHLLEPIRNAGIPLHATLGNHDHRGHAVQVRYPHAGGLDPRGHTPAFETGSVTVGGVRWLMLDSLRRIDEVAGHLGEAQRQWLDQQLAADPTPTVIVVHHQPQHDRGEGWAGLIDTGELWPMLTRHRHVRAWVHGHTHRWSRTDRDGIAIAGLPPTAYTFQADAPAGFIVADTADGRLTLTLHSLDPTHPQHGQSQVIELA